VPSKGKVLRVASGPANNDTIKQMAAMTVEQAIQLAAACVQGGRLADAESLCRQVLAAQPDHAGALYQLGTLILGQSRPQEALELLQRAADLQPGSAACRCDLGVVYRLLGRLDMAVASYRQALTLQPDLAAAHANLGEVLAHLRRFDEAVSSYRRALELQPEDAETLNNFGNALQKKGRAEEALEALRRALVLKPDYVEAFYNLGLAYAALARWQDAIAVLRHALDLRPGFVEALNNLGSAYLEAGNISDAMAHIRRSIELRPDYAMAHNNLGRVLMREKRLDEAVLGFQQALRIDARCAPAHSNLGAAFLEMDRLEEAMACFQQAIALDEEIADAHWNLGVALLRQGQFDEAARCCRRAIACQADHPAAHLNLGLILLSQGHYEEGWREYEWRSRDPRNPSLSANFCIPRWDGRAAPGQKLLVHSEQGFGDTIQFARYLPLVKKRSGAQQVVFACPVELHRLFAGLRGLDAQLVARHTEGPIDLRDFDQHVPLLSLHLALGISDPSSHRESYLTVAPDLTAQWRARIRGGGALRVGLAWRGNPAHENDRNRSLPAQHFLPFLQIPGVTCYSLQVHAPADERRHLSDAGLVDLTAEIRDFSDTAALIVALDLVITADTVVAHLAGALGRPVWTLLPFIPDWRWGLERDDTPWYPAMRLFRQTRAGDWDSVVQRASAALVSFVKQAGA
jgi:tetratricopeptide (TPR) repeat protein